MGFFIRYTIYKIYIFVISINILYSMDSDQIGKSDLVEAVKAMEEISPSVFCIPDHKFKQYETEIEEFNCMGNYKVEAFKPIPGTSPHYGLTLEQMRSSLSLFWNKI